MRPLVFTGGLGPPRLASRPLPPPPSACSLRSPSAVTCIMVWLGLCTAGCEKPLVEDECLQLLDRYTEFLVREEDPKATPQQVAHGQEAARTAARTNPAFEFSTCSRKVRRKSYECAMTAASVDAMERCLVF